MRLPVVLAALAALVLAPSAAASGGSSIADAPALAYGQVSAGGGLEQEFWRVALYSGDKITFLANLEGEPFREYGFTLYGPAVTDYNLRSAGSSDEAALSGGKNEFFLKAPFSGTGTLDVCQGLVENTQPCGQLAVDIITPLLKQAEPYSFTATVTHATSLQITAPTLARPGAIVTVRASVNSPAGTPQGSCLIQGRVAPVAGAPGACGSATGAGRRSRSRSSPMTAGRQPTATARSDWQHEPGAHAHSPGRDRGAGRLRLRAGRHDHGHKLPAAVHPTCWLSCPSTVGDVPDRAVHADDGLPPRGLAVHGTFGEHHNEPHRVRRWWRGATPRHQLDGAGRYHESDRRAHGASAPARGHHRLPRPWRPLMDGVC
jgi:hypothetical protein